MDSNRIVGLLATPERLRVVAAVVLGHGSLVEISAVTGLEEKAAADALGRLVGGGLVLNQGGTFVVDEHAFVDAARADQPPSSPHDGPTDDRSRTLQRVFDGERLVEIPARRSTRRYVLDELAQRFEVGVRYSEREVNDSLRRAHPDVAALRRYLVDEGLLSRDAGEYWRSGGTVDVE